MLGFSNGFTADSIPNQTGRVVVVTGGNAGLGKQTIIAFVRKGAKVYMGARTESKALAAIKEIKDEVPSANIAFLPLDLASFASISSAAKNFTATESQLHILVNNAGVLTLPYSTTSEGYEIQFGTNHLGHFLLTKLLLPALEATAETAPEGSVRIVNVASVGHIGAWRGINFENMEQQLKSGLALERYAVGKLSNILHARSLAQRYPKIVSVSAHPGVILSGLYDTLLGSNVIINGMKSLAKMVTSDEKTGAYNQLYLATMPQVTLSDSGEYYNPVGMKASGLWQFPPVRPFAYAKDEALAEQLWEWSEAQVAKHGF